MCDTKEVRTAISAFVLSVAFNTTEEAARKMMPRGHADMPLMCRIMESVAHKDDKVSQGWGLMLYREGEDFETALADKDKHIRFLHYRDGKIHKVTKVAQVKTH